MTYSEELKAFRATHTYETKIVEGSTFHYVLSGKKRWKNAGTVKRRNEHDGDVDVVCRCPYLPTIRFYFLIIRRN